ncbi:MAG: ATP-binding cassette domain-containing protein [Bacteroidetes bacterium]|nr:ATP-binding cassette domain-containing protein [Bacteroidota bacterium]
MSVIVENLCKVYGEQIAVNGISFSVKKGEVLGFLGPNGAGKSTTMKMITGYLPSTSGKAIVCGKVVGEHTTEIQKQIGYLPESNPLYMDMYVKEYLQFLAGVHQISDAANKVEQIMVQTGLKAEERKTIGALSKGYKQRVGIAQSMLHNPDVLILDEPTSGLDPNQIVEIRDLIKQFGKEKTVILSTHIMQEVEAMCDRVIIIYKGNLVADDTLKGLQGKYPNQTLEEIFRSLTIASDAVYA